MRISLVTPMYDEEEVVELFFSRVTPILEGLTSDWEIVCVNDGSRDSTLEKLQAASAADPRIRVVDLSRNFGKELALSAGLDHADGDVVVPMDVDLQDPPELIVEMVALWRRGFDVVLAKRLDRSTDSWGKRVSAGMFYRLIQKLSDIPIPEQVGDFRLMDRRVVQALASLPERTRFMKGIFAWLGFRQAVVTYARPARAAGTTKWRFGPLWRFALEGLVSFTSFPLKLWSYVGIAVSALAGLYGLWILLRTLFLGVDVPGYASLAVLILFFNGILLTGLGVMGEYVARIFVEVKGRPLYLVRETYGFPADDRRALPAYRRERP